MQGISAADWIDSCCIMAASGAHLTSTALSVTDRPSIFEVLAQENLVSALHPALKHALHVGILKSNSLLCPLICPMSKIICD